MYSVASPNAYESTEDAQRTINVKVLNVLFNQRVCNLVYLRDLSSMIKSRKQD